MFIVAVAIFVTFPSPANIWHRILLQLSGDLLLYKQNGSGPKTEPCGTANFETLVFYCHLQQILN